jgi:hypothetical protein
MGSLFMKQMTTGSFCPQPDCLKLIRIIDTRIYFVTLRSKCWNLGVVANQGAQADRGVAQTRDAVEKLFRGEGPGGSPSTFAALPFEEMAFSGHPRNRIFRLVQEFYQSFYVLGRCRQNDARMNCSLTFRRPRSRSLRSRI